MPENRSLAATQRIPSVLLVLCECVEPDLHMLPMLPAYAHVIGMEETAAYFKHLLVREHNSYLTTGIRFLVKMLSVLLSVDESIQTSSNMVSECMGSNLHALSRSPTSVLEQRMHRYEKCNTS